MRRVRFGFIPVVVAVFALVSAGPAAASDLTPTQVQAQQWWIGRLGLQQVWSISEGAGVTVAVIDTGVNADFGDLRGALVPGFNVEGPGNGQQDTDPNIHGTLMADNIAGRGTGFGLYGVARKAKILPVADAGSTTVSLTAALARLTALPHPPQIVNMSSGGPSPCSPELQAAVVAASAKGIILVAAAGNDANVTNASQNPANCIGVIAVGAYDQNIRAWDGSQRQPYVSLAGPGVHMIDAYPSIASGYGYGTGTSDAAAIVSGTLAVVRSKFPTLSSRDIVTRVLATARQFQGAPGTHNNTWGYGAARPRHALTDTVPANAPNPVYDALAKLSGASKAPPSSGASGSSETPTAGPSGPQTIAAPPGGTATSSTGSSNVGLVVGIVVAVLVLLAVVLFVVLRGRRRTGGHGPTGPSGPWNGPPRGPGPGSW